MLVHESAPGLFRLGQGGHGVGSGPLRLVLYSTGYEQQESSGTGTGEETQVSQSMSSATPDQTFSPHSMAVGKPHLQRGRTLSAMAQNRVALCLEHG